MRNSVESAMFFIISGEGDCIRREGMLTLCLLTLYNSFTFFASAYHNFSKCVIHLREIKESEWQMHQLRGPTGSEATAKRPRKLRDTWGPCVSASGSSHSSCHPADFWRGNQHLEG